MSSSFSIPPPIVPLSESFRRRVLEIQIKFIIRVRLHIQNQIPLALGSCVYPLILVITSDMNYQQMDLLHQGNNTIVLNSSLMAQHIAQCQSECKDYCALPCLQSHFLPLQSHCQYLNLHHTHVFRRDCLLLHLGTTILDVEARAFMVMTDRLWRFLPQEIQVVPNGRSNWHETSHLWALHKGNVAASSEETVFALAVQE